jgi:hypothetical protein
MQGTVSSVGQHYPEMGLHVMQQITMAEEDIGLPPSACQGRHPWQACFNSLVRLISPAPTDNTDGSTLVEGHQFYGINRQ